VYLIRLFEMSRKPVRHLRIPLKALSCNVAAAGLGTALTVAGFAIAFAAEEGSHTDASPAEELALGSIALVVLILGVALGAALDSFPWVAFFLTPFLFASVLIFLSHGDWEGVWTNLLFGSYTSVILAVGALAGRGLKGLGGRNDRRQRQKALADALRLSRLAPLTHGTCPSAEDDIREDRSR
jgi:hypothetical protein